MHELVVLRAAGTALLLDVGGPALPRVVHWGADPGDLTTGQARTLALAAAPALPNSGLDAPWAPSLVPSEADGWSGRPGVAGWRPSGGPPPRLRLVQPVEVSTADDTQVLRAAAADEEAGVAVEVELRLEPCGVVRVRHHVTPTSSDGWVVAGALPLLPIGGQATEVLDLTGRWCRERSPQRSPLLHGGRVRESRRGRTGHDATLLMVAGTAGFGFRHGEVWGVHAAWSGDHVHLVDRLPEARAMLGGGELLRPGEVVLGDGETYSTPWSVFSWSDAGLDGLSARLHEHVRHRAHHTRSPRPVVLNTWEAVYFEHDLDRLRELADVAADVGVERFVLDDGWFLGRRDDTAGLGDWYVDPDVWPDGLHPLVEHVRGLGLQVGLWVEPEMANPDSDLVRDHPGWLLCGPGREPLLWRGQLVVDVAHPDAHRYLLERLDALVGEYRLDYLKWDHNRDLHEAVHDGRAGVHAQTRAVYRLVDELRARHPGLEIESCSSGGARVDLGVLEHTDRVWASDTNDAVERQRIQRWTGLLLPPELVGSHVGPARAHTTGRVVELPFRLLTALFGHPGIEWDITTCTPDELDRVRAWAALYRQLRPLLHTGTTVRGDLDAPADGGPGPAVDAGAVLHGVVSEDRRNAAFAYARLESAPDAVPPPVRLPGLDAAQDYRVRWRPEVSSTPPVQQAPPPWMREDDGVVLPGRVLASHGLAVPVLGPGQGVLLTVTAT
ncbi:MAG TPA: alpha-galactosidase [Actinomycetales bacterium]|nr:alpha-galactosidase [Actinomycetales bacterium]